MKVQIVPDRYPYRLCTMGNICGVLFCCYFDVPFRNKRACNGCTEKIAAFVDCVCLENREDVVCYKFLFQVFYIDLACSDFQSLFSCSFEVIKLSCICNVRDNIVSIGQQSMKNDRCIKSPAVCEYYWINSKIQELSKIIIIYKDISYTYEPSVFMAISGLRYLLQFPLSCLTTAL